jgi:hypothetical protein
LAAPGAGTPISVATSRTLREAVDNGWQFAPKHRAAHLFSTGHLPARAQYQKLIEHMLPKLDLVTLIGG